MTGLVSKTHQQAYISVNVAYIVLSREAMESLRFVSNLDDRKKASVNLVSSTVMHPYYSKSSSPLASPVAGLVANGSSLRSSRVQPGRARFYVC